MIEKKKTFRKIGLTFVMETSFMTTFLWHKLSIFSLLHFLNHIIFISFLTLHAEVSGSLTRAGPLLGAERVGPGGV